MNIINKCSKTPPFAIWHIEKALEWISPVDLVGIEYIELADKAPESLVKIDFVPHLRNFAINGLYFSKTKSSCAHISLFIDAIYYPIPRFVYFAPMTTLLIAKTLAHEVAHHVAETKGYVFEPSEKIIAHKKSLKYEEEMADRYSFEVLQKMKTKLEYKLGAEMMNFISDCYYGVAAARWEGRNYKSAADYWYKSSRLNSERQESVQWFWNSIEKLEEQTLLH